MSSAARYTVAVAICVLVTTAASCARSGSAATGGRPNVVAAENVWGSIAAQLGGDRVTVTSIIDNPDADPHDYEPTTDDARVMAAANLVIENGVGYDPWAQRLIDANPVSGRHVLDVGTLVGVTTGGNPHRWYSPADVRQVIDAITPSTRSSTRATHRTSTTSGRRSRRRDSRSITRSSPRSRRSTQARRSGRRRASSRCMAPALGLDLITPPSFLTRDQRRDGADGGRQGDDRPARSLASRSRCSSTTARTPPPTSSAGRRGDWRRASRSPRSPRRSSRPARRSRTGRSAQLRALAAALHEATGR